MKSIYHITDPAGFGSADGSACLRAEKRNQTYRNGQGYGPERRAADRRDRTGDGHDERRLHNATGDYSIQVPEGASLTFQYIGYEAKTEKVGARTKVDVKLEQSKQTIDEVVVIGYGTVKKTDLTGSVANVKMSDIKDVPVVSVDQALQGRIAGADIMATTGEPGATTSIRIRGTRSISASNEPLIIVDGVIDGIHDLNDINSADIESISVLKDASSTAIYGARGSNGVIVITTKKGRGMDGRPNITFKTDLGFRSSRVSSTSWMPRSSPATATTTPISSQAPTAIDKIDPDSPCRNTPSPTPRPKASARTGSTPSRARRSIRITTFRFREPPRKAPTTPRPDSTKRRESSTTAG